MSETNIADRAAVDIPRFARWDMAEGKADVLTASYSSPPVPVLEIAEENGVDVIFQDFGEFGNKVAGFCDFTNARLYVNSEDSPQRQSFTMAHELGHWLMHREIFEADPEIYPVLPRFQSVDKHNSLEQEANRFAAHLLVPDHLLYPVLKAPVSALAKIFKVSLSMMEFRVKNVRGN